MSWQTKDFDTILNNRLTNWLNQDPTADMAKGGLPFIVCTVIALGEWGLRKLIGWVAKQIFFDTSTTANIDHHGATWEVTRKSGETDAAYITRIKERIQTPPGAGTKADYIRWAKETTNVAKAYCYGYDDGVAIGSVEVVILCTEITGTADATEANKLHDADGGFISQMVGATVRNTTDGTETTVSAFVDSGELTLTGDIFVSGDAYAIEEIPNQALIDSVKTYLASKRPIPTAVSVLAPSLLIQDVTMTVTGSDADKTQIASEITSYLNGFESTQKLYVSQLVTIAIQNGADDASVSAPASDVFPTGYQMIRAGVISVT